MGHVVLTTIGFAMIACGPGASSMPDGTPVSLDAGDDHPPSCTQLNATLRDFRADHPDFEKVVNTNDRGITENQLDANHKPVYAHAGPTSTVSSRQSFDQWFREVPDVNMRFDEVLPLVEGPPGTYTFDDQTFFPLDGKGWPNQEIYGHNFLFTTEIHTSFKYRGGEQFHFNGDDDVLVFVNDRLALDLGGVHAAEDGVIDFDGRATELGLQIGGTYPLAVFHAERHTDQSHFKMVTSIDCFIIESQRR
jgi:fibro-slime domain-containing protein